MYTLCIQYVGLSFDVDISLHLWCSSSGEMCISSENWDRHFYSLYSEHV